MPLNRGVMKVSALTLQYLAERWVLYAAEWRINDGVSVDTAVFNRYEWRILLNRGLMTVSVLILQYLAER